MIELDLALEILNNDLDNDIPFADALKKVFLSSPDKRIYRKDVAGLLGCELRHHQLFTYLVANLEDFTIEDQRVAMLALANDYFFHHFERNVMDEAVKEKLGEEKFARLLPLLDLSDKPESYIPESIDRQSNLYLSLRYNVPEWLLKILQHEGHGATYRIIRQFSKPYVNYVRVTRNVNPEDLGVDYTQSKIEGIYAYTGHIPLRKVDVYRKGDLFDERPYVKMIFDKMKVSSADNVLLYSGQEGDEWENELLESMSAHSNINIASQNIDKKAALMHRIKEKEAKNVNLFAAPNPDEMVAAITNNCELVVAAPACSQFDRIASAPDYLLHFNREAMNEIYNKQLPVLEGCAKHVAQGGNLVYCLPTISRREGHRTVEAFLRNHPEFSLDEEKQIYPFEAMGVAFFYAVLFKGERAFSENPSTLAAIVKPEASAVASASEAE